MNKNRNGGPGAVNTTEGPGQCDSFELFSFMCCKHCRYGFFGLWAELPQGIRGTIRSEVIALAEQSNEVRYDSGIPDETQCIACRIAGKVVLIVPGIL